MKLSKREDIEAPIAFVYEALADTDHWERAALRRGADVTRQDSLPRVGTGSTWSLGFEFRGRPRRVTIRLSEMNPPQTLGFTGEGEALNGTLGVELVDLGPKRTRIIVALEVKPRTLAARLFLQTLKLAKTRVQDKFNARVGQIALDVGERFRRQKQG